MREIIKQKSGMIGKLFVYQIAMSLLGVFVTSPFSGRSQIIASVFAILFYFSLVCYAIIEDGQKDNVSHEAGRINGKGYTGFVYALISYIPTIVLVLGYSILSVSTNVATLSGLKSVLTGIVNRIFLMGMYLGLDCGISMRSVDPQTKMAVYPSETLEYFSENGLIFSCCLVLLPIVAGVTYYLAFKGKLHVNTAPKEKNKRK